MNTVLHDSNIISMYYKQVRCLLQFRISVRLHYRYQNQSYDSFYFRANIPWSV